MRRKPRPTPKHKIRDDVQWNPDVATNDTTNVSEKRLWLSLTISFDKKTYAEAMWHAQGKGRWAGLDVPLGQYVRAAVRRLNRLMGPVAEEDIMKLRRYSRKHREWRLVYANEKATQEGASIAEGPIDAPCPWGKEVDKSPEREGTQEEVHEQIEQDLFSGAVPSGDGALGIVPTDEENNDTQGEDVW